MLTSCNAAERRRERDTGTLTTANWEDGYCFIEMSLGDWAHISSVVSASLHRIS